MDTGSVNGKSVGQGWWSAHVQPKKECQQFKDQFTA